MLSTDYISVIWSPISGKLFGGTVPPNNTLFGGRVQKTLNFSYEPYPDISNFPTFSGTRQPDLGAKSNYFATKKTEKG